MEAPPTARIPESAISTARTTGRVVLIQSSPNRASRNFWLKGTEEVCYLRTEFL